MSTDIGIQHDHFNITLLPAKMEFIRKYIHYIMTKQHRHLIQCVPPVIIRMCQCSLKIRRQGSRYSFTQALFLRCGRAVLPLRIQSDEVRTLRGGVFLSSFVPQEPTPKSSRGAAPEGSFLPDTLTRAGEKRSRGTFVLFSYHKFKKSQGTTLPVFFFKVLL